MVCFEFHPLSRWGISQDLNLIFLKLFLPYKFVMRNIFIVCRNMLTSQNLYSHHSLPTLSSFVWTLQLPPKELPVSPCTSNILWTMAKWSLKTDVKSRYFSVQNICIHFHCVIHKSKRLCHKPRISCGLLYGSDHFLAHASHTDFHVPKPNKYISFTC